MKSKNTFVLLSKLFAGENPRLSDHVKLDSLIANINAMGLLTPIMAWAKDSSGNLEVIQGHRRLQALREIERVDNSRFVELFGKDGIPIKLVSDCTEADVIDLKLDHSDQQGLNDPYELQKSANMLFRIGRTEEQVASQLAGLIERFAPMASKVMLELKAISEKVEKAKTNKNAAAQILAEREYRDRFFQYRRGFAQGLHNIYRCPNKVMQALYKKATGNNPEGVAEYLPNITTTTVTKLWKAHEADLKIMDGGKPKYNRDNSGPLFTAAWDTLVKAEQDAATNPEAKTPRSMSAKEMEADKGEFESSLANIMTEYHKGNKDMKTEVSKLDKLCCVAELVQKHDPALWEMVEASAAAIVKTLKAAKPAA